MAIIRAIPRKGRRPVHAGRVMVDSVRGVLRVRKWPKKRGTPRSAAQRWWIDWFKQANLLAKYASDMDQARAIEMTKGSGMYPRDVLLKAMRGRLYFWADETGWKWYSVAAQQDVSNSLDALGQTVGSILVRALDRWRPPVPGNINDVMTYKGDTAPPVWAAPGGGGMSFGGALVTSLSNQAIPKNTWVKLNFTSEAYDTDALHDNAVNPSRLTVPVDWTRVRLTAAVQWASGSTARRGILFYKNNANFPGQAVNLFQAAYPTHFPISSPAIACVAGDYFEVLVFQATASTINVIGPSNNTYFAMERAT